MQRLIEWSMKSRLWVILIALAVTGAGIYSFWILPIDAVPDITNVQVMINTKTGALAPEEIETTVSYPIETELSGIQSIEEIRSLSKYGLSQVIVVFNDAMDLYFARQLIAERLQNLGDRLPAGVTPEMGPISTGLGEIFMYEVMAKPGSDLASKPEEERLRALRTVQDWKIKPEIRSVPGVAEVDSNGGYRKAIHINLDPRKMERYGLSMRSVEESLSDTGINRGGGYIETEGQRIIVRTQGRFTHIDQIRKVPIRTYAIGEAVPLHKIAAVESSNEPRVGATTSDGAETVIGTVMMRIGANSKTVSEEVERKLAEIELPPDVSVKVLYARSFLVGETIRTVGKNLIEGAILVIVILLLILGNIRAAIIVSLAIPISMLFAVTGMVQGGISANLMSLGAIDFGLLVDASVVMIENIIRRIETSGRHSFTADEKFRMISEAAKEVAGPVTSGLLIIMIVYVPILSLSGIEGKMFRPMAATVLIALAASLIVALTLMPVLALLFLKKGAHHETRIFSRIIREYRKILHYSMHNRVRVLVPSALFALITFLLFFRLGSDFIPQLDEGDLVIGLVRRADISLSESVEMQKRSERVIKSFPEVARVFSRMGTPESATDPMGINFADTFVMLEKNRNRWPVQENGGRRSKDELYAAISEAIERGVPGQEISPTQPIEMRFNEMLEGSRADVTLRIYGPDLMKLLELVKRAQGILETIDGVSEVGMDELTALRRTPLIDVRLNHDSISRYGVHTRDVNDAFETAMAGKRISTFIETDIGHPIVLRMDDRFRNTPPDILRIPIDLPGGGVIPFGSFASIEKRDQITTIARYNAKRYAAVAVYLKDRDIQSFVDEAKMKIGAELNLPDGFHIEWAGQFKNLEKAKLRLLMIIPVVLLLILIILLRSFNNIRQTALVFSAVPFAVTGGILSLYLRGIPFSISAAVGFIALTGIAILNGTVLVSFFNELREKGIPLVEAVYEGALTRLRPVLMTALVASLGFIPMAVNTGAGSEVQRPIATVVIGGIVSSTILTLLLLPTLYFWIEEHSGKRTPPAKYVPDESAEVFRLESEGAERKARRGRRKG